jgi:hypothetical protein
MLSTVSTRTVATSSLGLGSTSSTTIVPCLVDSNATAVIFLFYLEDRKTITVGYYVIPQWGERLYIMRSKMRSRHPAGGSALLSGPHMADLLTCVEARLIRPKGNFPDSEVLLLWTV